VKLPPKLWLDRKIGMTVKAQDLTTFAARGSRLASVVRVVALTGVCVLTAASAIVTKESLKSSDLVPLARVDVRVEPNVKTNVSSLRLVSASVGAPVLGAEFTSPDEIRDPLAAPAAAAPEIVVETVETPSNLVDDTSIRFFNGRPVKPARTIRMSVTAYSPDENSCAGSDDGITSSNHDVHTNAMKLVAADSRVLPLGSLVSVPGYDEGRVVPVLDRGGAIKGNKLDVLYPTHEIAKRWGRRSLTVTVWEYADGLPACDYRKIRDSKN
jgi:3D (Asp-Asp-Asp) domain-containing protein